MIKNIRYLIKNALIYGLGNTSSKIVGFILLPIYTKHLTVSDYGILGIVEITTQIIIAIFSFSIYSAFLRWYWDKEYSDKQKSIFFTIFIFLVFVSIFTFIFLYIISDLLSLILFDSHQYTFLIKLMAIAACLQIISQLIATLMRIQEKSTLYSLTNIIKFSFTLIITIYFIIYLNQKVEGIYQAQIIGLLIYLVLLIKYIIRNMEPKFESTILKEMFFFSLPLVFSSVGTVMLAITDKYSLKFLVGLSAVGIYALGFKIANTIKIFITRSVQLALSPLNYKMMGQPDNKRFYSKIMTYFTFGVMFFVIGISIFSMEIIKVMASNKDYWIAYKIVPIISFAMLFEMLKDTSTIGLTIMKKTKIIGTIFILMTVLNLSLNLMLIPIFDAMGAAIATVVTHILFFILILFYAQKYYFIPYELIKISKMIILGVILVSICFLTTDLDLYLRIIIKTLALIAFPVILYFWNLYEDIELVRIRQSWLKWRDPRNWKRNIAEFGFDK